MTKWRLMAILAVVALLAAACGDDGDSATTTTPTINIQLAYRDVVRGYLPQPAVVAQDIQAQLAEIGVNVEIVVMESGAFIDASDAGELTMYLLGWGADYPDATNFYDFHFGVGASDQFGDKFADITGLLTQAASLSDQAERDALYAQVAELIKQHVPMIPVAHGGSGLAYKADVVGAHASPLGNEYFAVVDPGGRDTFVWMQNAEPIGLYCADETDGESLRACEQINESLLFFEVGGTETEPGLATSCDANEDLTEWTCTLRQGVVFHDGSAFDANDVVMSYVVQWDENHPLHVGRDGSFTYFPGLFGGFLTEAPVVTGPTMPTEAFEPLSYSAPSCDYDGMFKTIESVDAYTVRFELCSPDVAFRSKIAFSAFAIHSWDHLQATGGGGDALISNPIGTGPYQMQQWDRGNQVIMTRFDDYWGTPAIAETLVFRWSTEAAQRLVELQAGSVDGIDNLGPDDFPKVEADANLQLIERPALNIFYIGFNNWKTPLDNEKVRQALAMGIDRQRIVDNFYPPGSAVADQFLPPALPGFAPGITWYEFDQAAARALLAEAFSG